eukprot:g633.t1
MDADGSGDLDLEEFEAAMTSLSGRKFEQAELEEAFALLDADGSGTIDVSEFQSLSGAEGVFAGVARTAAGVLLNLLTITANAMTPIKFFKPKSNALEPFDMLNLFRADASLFLRAQAEAANGGVLSLISALSFPSIVNTAVGTISFQGYSSILEAIEAANRRAT